jgi:hypothetical protein
MTAIQNALNAAKKIVGTNRLHGGVVTVPEGTFLCWPLNVFGPRVPSPVYRRLTCVTPDVPALSHSTSRLWDFRR